MKIELEHLIPSRLWILQNHFIVHQFVKSNSLCLKEDQRMKLNCSPCFRQECAVRPYKEMCAGVCLPCSGTGWGSSQQPGGGTRSSSAQMDLAVGQLHSAPPSFPSKTGCSYRIHDSYCWGSDCNIKNC